MTPTTARPNRRPIYIESRIHAPVDALWDATQLPDSHQRWDVRFGSISYLPRVDGEAQRFTYTTTVAPGVTIAGTGESLGERDRPDGTRWSGLKFWAADRHSIIKAGAGYWRYVPTDDGVRFLTRYDYRPRWGPFGELVDRVLFRPVFGWATAWSFDRLRLWLEEGTPPERSRDQAIAHTAAVAGLAGVFAYQGLVPKVWKVDDGEVAIWRGLGLPQPTARRVVRAVGGTHQHLAVDLHCWVDDKGAMCLRSGEQRLYEGPLALRFPLLFSGVAEVREWWDPAAERFGIEVCVANRTFGPLFGYRGSFTVEEQPCAADQIPRDVRPVREEARE